MGLASSQARLLLLTARKSDLEFRAQRITNSTMMLAMQTEEVAREYSLRLSNQTLKLITDKTTEVDFKASSLADLTAKDGSKMILQMRVGKDDKGNDIWADWAPNGGTVTKGYKNADGEEISIEAYNALPEAERAGCSPITEKVETSNDYDGPAILEGMNAGTMRIVYDDGTANSQNAKQEDINGTKFSVAYDTSDDAKADAEYRRKTAAIQVKEKRLQMDLTQVETQQKACETEIDSVKKIMDKNIERTFKVFS